MIEPILDVSHWQGYIEEDITIKAGALAVIIRAGSVNANTGVCYEDHNFYLNADKFKDKLPEGYYWYFRPEKDPIAQAKFFCDRLDEVWWNISPVVDVESNTGYLSQGQFQESLKKFLDYVEARLSVKCVIYTRGEFWNTNLGNPSWAGNYKLWIARYNLSLNSPWGDGFYRPYPWADWWLWQYSADGNGRGAEFGADSSDIDINRYNGTLEEFYADIGWNQEPPPSKAWCKIIQGIKNLCEKYLKEYCP